MSRTGNWWTTLGREPTGVTAFIQHRGPKTVEISDALLDDEVVNACFLLPSHEFIVGVNQRLPETLDDFVILMDGTAVPDEGWWPDVRSRFAMSADVVILRTRGRPAPHYQVNPAGSVFRTEFLQTIGGLDVLSGDEWSASLTDATTLNNGLISVLGDDADPQLNLYPQDGA